MSKTHLQSVANDGKRTGAYCSWLAAKRRCTDKKSKDYSRYGGVGITFSKEWFKFENFLRDMGERPEGKSLDRINGKKGYSKNNCRWATRKQQRLNQKPTTHCRRGHKFTKKITHVKNSGKRSCRICEKIWYNNNKERLLRKKRQDYANNTY